MVGTQCPASRASEQRGATERQRRDKQTQQRDVVPLLEQEAQQRCKQTHHLTENKCSNV